MSNSAAAKPKVSPTIHAFFHKTFRYSKDLFYFGVVVGGFTVCGTILFTMVKELTAESSITQLMDRANKQVLEDSYVKKTLGEPLVFDYGTGGRLPASHLRQDTENNSETMLCQYLVRGPIDRAQIHTECTRTIDSNPNFLQKLGILDNANPWTLQSIQMVTRTGLKYYILAPPVASLDSEPSKLQSMLSSIFSLFSPRK